MGPRPDRVLPDTSVPHPPTPFDPAHPFAVMVEHVRDYAIFLLDPDGRITSWNPAAERMKGYRADEIIGHSLAMLYPEASQEAGEPERNLLDARRAGTYVEEGWRCKKDGSLFWALIEIIRLDDADGVHRGYCKVTKDLTSRKRLEDALQREKERAQVMLDAIGDAVLSVDADGRIEFLNPMAERLSGWGTDAIRGCDVGQLLVLETAADEHGRALVERLCQARAFTEECPALLATRDGRRCSIDGVAAAIPTPAGEGGGCVIVFRDVTKTRAHLADLKHQATHDALTGLANRAGFDLHLQRSIERVGTSTTSSALIFLDLDGFKAVNDSAGHGAGDEMLRRVAQALATHIRERDTLARIGGDEFVLLLDGCTRDAARAVADKLRDAIADVTVRHGGRWLKVGASIGITMVSPGDTGPDAMHRADQAAYAAKFGGGGRVYFPRLN